MMVLTRYAYCAYCHKSIDNFDDWCKCPGSHVKKLYYWIHREAPIYYKDSDTFMNRGACRVLEGEFCGIDDMPEYYEYKD